MIAVDTNILVYAHREDSPFCQAARVAIQELADSGESWAIPWPCVHEFFSTVTRRTYMPPTPPALAIQAITMFLQLPQVQLLHEGEGYWPLLENILHESGIVGPMVHDARIAAICLLHDVETLWTADRDFVRFPQLNTTNPLIGRRSTKR